MIERSYNRLIENVGVIVKIRNKRGLLNDQSLYPERWLKLWKPLLENNDWDAFIKSHFKKKDTALFQIKRLINIINISIISIPIIISLMLIFK